MIDIAVILIYFVIILWIGLSQRSKEASVEEYSLGNRSIPWWPILASILAAEISAATFLGAPGEGFSLRNYTYAQLCLGTVLARLLVAWLFIKKFYDYGVVSIYEFLEIRFGKITRCVGSLIFLLTRTLASGTRLYVAAIFLVLGFEITLGRPPSEEEEILIYGGILTLIVCLTAIYTTIGGIKAVIWTDLIQASILVVSLISTLGILLFAIPGGFAGAQSVLQQPTDLQIFDLGITSGGSLWRNIFNILNTEYTLFAALLGSTFITLATHGTDQDMVQRMLTAKNPTESRRAVILSGIIDIPIVLTFLSVGILLYVFYHYYPDPRLPAKSSYVFPFFVLTKMPAGLRGLVVAALLATAMGSLSTALNSLATSFYRDFYLSYIASSDTSDRKKILAIRMATIGFSILLVLVGMGTAWIVVKKPDTRILPIVLGSFGYTYGSLLGVFLVGLLTRRGNDFGNMLAMFAGFVVVALFSHLPQDIATLIGIRISLYFDLFPPIAFPWRILFGSVTTFVVACMFPSKQESTVSVYANRPLHTTH